MKIYYNIAIGIFILAIIIYIVVSSLGSSTTTGSPTTTKPLALTKELYKAGPRAYKNVTYIPDNEFANYKGNVTLEKMPFLKRIGKNAFYNFNGNLNIKGDYLLLEIIDTYAFKLAGNTESVIELTGLNSLKIIGDYAFEYINGKIILTGECNKLETIGINAFHNIRQQPSLPDGEYKITLTGLNSLKTIRDFAFYGNLGKIILTGECTKLETIGRNAFYPTTNAESLPEETNTESVIKLSRLESLKIIHEYAFMSFGGVLTFTCDSNLLEIIGNPVGNPGCFQNVNNNKSTVTFKDCNSLKHIGNDTFHDFKGTVIFTGKYPLLETIGSMAFQNCMNANSKIEFTGLESLTNINSKAFDNFKGNFNFTGSYPNLETISDRAFRQTGNINSIINLQELRNLKHIDSYSFQSYKGNIIFKSSCPNLETINENAFIDAGDKNSVIELNELINLTQIHPYAFELFSGTLKIIGNFPKYKGCTRVKDKDKRILVCGISEIPLSKETYISKNKDDNDKITCIPDEEFAHYDGDVTFNGLPNLKHIGLHAFFQFKGTLTIKGEYPKLETIGDNASWLLDSFKDASKTESGISFKGHEECKGETDIAEHCEYSFLNKTYCKTCTSYKLIQITGIPTTTGSPTTTLAPTTLAP